MAKGKREGKVTQKEMVRAGLAELGAGAPPLDLQEYIKTTYQTELSTQVISNYKSVLKKESGGSAPKAGRKGGATFSDLEAVQGLVSRLGAAQVRKLVDVAEMFA